VFAGIRDFDPGPGVYNLVSAGESDGVVLSLDSDGNFVWARGFGGASSDWVAGLALSPAGNIYVTGQFAGTAQFGAHSLTSADRPTGYLTQLDSGGGFVTAHAFPHEGLGVTVDAADNVDVAGRFSTSWNSPMAMFPTGDRVASVGDDFTLLRFSAAAPPTDPTPAIDVFTASSNGLSGDPLTLHVARVHDPDERFHAVDFYRDNGDGLLDPAVDLLVGSDDDSTSTTTPYGGWMITTSLAGLATGNHTYFAQGIDAAGAVLDVAAASVHVQEVEIVGYESGDAPKPIPDRATVTSTIIVPDPFTVLDVDVALDISHTYVQDLEVFLIAPDGTQVMLFSDVGNNLDRFTGTTLDDEASTSISRAAPPFTGRFRPEAPLPAFDGKNAAGVWTLEITDDDRRDSGTLISWSIHVARAADSDAPTSP
jgi:subtilisin-like proprotein convertase family protein